MELRTTGSSGTYESSDIFVTIEPGSNGIEIDLKSSVEKQFGDQIRTVITETLNKIGITDAKVNANDTGALDCVIRARVQGAAYKSAQISENIDWEALDGQA